MSGPDVGDAVWAVGHADQLGGPAGECRVVPVRVGGVGANGRLLGVVPGTGAVVFADRGMWFDTEPEAECRRDQLNAGATT